MPVENVFFLGLVISAFVAFAAVLTYAESVTRRATAHPPQSSQIKRQSSLHAEESTSVRKAA